MLDHPTVGIGWVVVCLLMAIVLYLKSKGYLPVSLYGMLLGATVTWGVNTIAGPDSDPLQFEPEQFMYILLPPIVLNSGLKFNLVEAQGTIGTSMVLAWFGTVGTALWVALGLWTQSKVEPWIIAFWIGSILSPTDPVGTLDQMAKLKEVYPIRLVLEHESLLNDAVAVMLVHTAQRTWELDKNMSKVETMEVIAVALGLTVAACLIGGITSLTLCHINRTDPIFVLVVGMLIFSICESIGASGIIGLFTYGAVLAHKATTLEHTKRTVQYLADFSEIYVYITMGGVVTQSSFTYWGHGFDAILATFVGRVVNVLFFTILARIGGVRWNIPETIFMSVCGMRGAVSLALAISAPVEFRTMFVTITVMEVLFSMVFTSIAANWCMVHLNVFPTERTSDSRCDGAAR
jgi:monovalent cation/hydrogen antiporter